MDEDLKNDIEEEIADPLRPSSSEASDGTVGTLENQSNKLIELENKYKRALADYHNLMKQSAKEKMDFARYANEGLLRELLPVYDNLKTSLQHLPTDANKNWSDGLGHVIKQFKTVLEDFGVKEIKTEQEKFDHSTMEAVEQVETDDKKLDDKVAKELKAGYLLNGKVISAARVSVYKVKK